MTLTPETKITIKTACSVIAAGIAGCSGLALWLDKRFDAQAESSSGIGKQILEVRRDVDFLRAASGRVWTMDHQQVWTDIYNQNNQAGKIPTPWEVQARLRERSVQ